MRILEPGAYPCRVEHPTAGGLPGLVSIQAGKGVEVHIYEWPEDPGQSWSFGGQHSLPILRCDLHLGVHLTLFDAIAHETFPDRLWVVAPLAVAAPPGHVDADVAYFGAQVQITNGHRVFGTWPIQKVQWPSVPPATGTEELSAFWDVDSTITTQFGEGIDLIASYTRYQDITDRYRFTVTSEPTFALSSTAAKSPSEWMSDVLVPLREFVSLATLEPQRFAAASVDRPDDDERDRQVDYTLYSPDIDQQPYRPVSDPKHDGLTLLTLKDVTPNLHSVVARWLQFRQKQPGVAGPLFSTLTEPADARSQFLGLVQALEGLHGYRFSQGKVTEEVHRARRDEVLAEVAELGASDASIAWLEKWADRYGRYTLPERLQQLKEDSEDDLEGIKVNRLEPRRIAKIRNELSHGAATAYSAAELRPHVQAMALVGIAQLLRVLDVAPTNLSRFFR